MSENPAGFDYDGYPDDLRELLLAASYEIDKLFRGLSMGKIALSKWSTEMVKILTRYSIAAFIEGTNGGTALTPADKKQIAIQVAKQKGFLERFVEEIANATEFQADKWRRRALSYARALVAPYWEGSTAGLPLPAMPGDLTSQCKQNCHCHWGIITLDKKAGDYDCYWVLGDAKHCQTCEVRADEWKPLRIRNGLIVLDTVPVTEDVLMGIGTGPSTQINVTATKAAKDALALVDFGGRIAELTPMGWICRDDPTLGNILENERKVRFMDYTPTPVAAEAHAAADSFHGTIIHTIEESFSPGLVY